MAGFLDRLFGWGGEKRKEKPLSALVLSGWGQEPDCLKTLLPADIKQVRYFDYSHYQSKEEVVDALKALDFQPDVVVGWSLGGRLAVRAVAQEALKPKLLVLLGASYQFLPEGGINNAAEGTKDGFYEAFRESPEQARAKLLEGMMKGDARAGEIRQQCRMDKAHDAQWLHWLKAMQFSSEDLNLSRLPRTLLVHGAGDALVKADQAELFHQRIPQSQVMLIPECGHAPHLHAPQQIRQRISQELHALNLSAGGQAKG